MKVLNVILTFFNPPLSRYFWDTVVVMTRTEMSCRVWSTFRGRRGLVSTTTRKQEPWTHLSEFQLFLQTHLTSSILIVTITSTTARLFGNQCASWWIQMWGKKSVMCNFHSVLMVLIATTDMQTTTLFSLTWVQQQTLSLRTIIEFLSMCKDVLSVLAPRIYLRIKGLLDCRHECEALSTDKLSLVDTSM